MKRIYTRTGDDGTTGIFGGERVGKDDIRIEANGTIDELNTVIGIVRSLLSEQDEWQGWLSAIQMELMACMSHIATPSAKRNENPNVFRSDLTGIFEEGMDKMTDEVGDKWAFILAGGGRGSGGGGFLGRGKFGERQGWGGPLGGGFLGRAGGCWRFPEKLLGAAPPPQPH